MHALGQQLQKKLDIRWAEEKKEQLQALWDKNRAVVARSCPSKWEARSLYSAGSCEEQSIEDLLSTVLHLNHRLMLVEFREQEVTTGVKSSEVLD